MQMRDFSLVDLSKSTCKTVLNKGNVWLGKAESRFASELIVSL